MIIILPIVMQNIPDMRRSFHFEGTIIEGELPKRAIAFVQEWIALHKDESDANWQRAKNGDPLHYIAPLE